MLSLKRNPRMARNLVFLIFLCGVAATAVAFILPDAGRGLTFQAVLGISGILITPIAFVFTLIKAVDTWRFDRLLRGQGIVARWRIDASSWQAFVRNEEVLDQQPDRRPNLLSYRDVPAANSVEVIVGQDALLIGGEFHAMSKRGMANIYGPHWLPGSPGCIQFDLTAFVCGGTHAMRWVLRFPVARDAEQQAGQVIAHFQSFRPRQATRNPARSRNRALTAAGIGAAIFTLALMLRGWVQDQSWLAGIAVIAVLASIASMILALFWHLQQQKTGLR